MGMKKTFEDTVTWIYNLIYLVGLSFNFLLRRNRKIPQTCNSNCFLKIQRIVRFLKTSESMSFSICSETCQLSWYIYTYCPLFIRLWTGKASVEQ